LLSSKLLNSRITDDVPQLTHRLIVSSQLLSSPGSTLSKADAIRNSSAESLLVYSITINSTDNYFN